MQSFGEQDLYPSIEEKAAHLLYFIIKNHPFIDGNKRSGAYAFVWFLRQAKILDITKITPAALTAICLSNMDGTKTRTSGYAKNIIGDVVNLGAL